jgi:hypothetical protein
MVAGLAFAGALNPAHAQLQYNKGLSDRVAMATDLENKAKALYPAPKRYREAARLLVEAAALRDAGDPQRIDNLRQAGRLFHYAGVSERARSVMEQAADAALAAGDVKTAAAAYLDAAFLAQDVKRIEDARRMIEKARLLTNSPLLSAEEKSVILERINAAA